MLRSHTMSKNESETQQNPGVTESEHEGSSDDERKMLTEANTDQNALLQALTTMLRTELKDFKEEVRRDLDEFKNDVKKVLKDDLEKFKGEVLQELQSQNANIAEAQTRIADMESACLVMKETLLAVVKEKAEMREKVVDLESRSRRNNIRIYGVPEGKEGRSVTEFVNELFIRHLDLPEGVEPRVQRAHRALVQKPNAAAAAVAPPRSIIVNFLEFQVKELVLRKAWQKKIEMDGKRLYFDNDYATDIVERRKAYGPIKAALKEKAIRYQTPYTKMRVHWETGLVIYSSAEEAARDLNRRGIRVKLKIKASIEAAAEGRLNAALPWKRTNISDSAAQRAKQRLTEFRRDPDQEISSG